MTTASHSPSVQSVAQEFRERYPHHILRSDSDDKELWFECRGATPSRARAPLVFGISDGSVTVAYDGLVCPMIIHPPTIKAETARQTAFALFDDLISERKVSISFWEKDNCLGVEFIPSDRIQSQRSNWVAHEIRVRSWSGKYDHDYAA